MSCKPQLKLIFGEKMTAFVQFKTAELSQAQKFNFL